MPSQQALAGYLGYLSIAFWLCAQLPQVVKNAKLQSCEGLALPFLINWLFGDITNFIGCVLTDQLPFQTYLAGYFCLIDFALCVQYFHYSKPTPPHASIHSGYTPSPSIHASLILPARSSSRPGTSRTRTTSSPMVQPFTAVIPPPDTATSNRSHSTVRPKPRRHADYGSSSTLDSPGLYTDGSYAALYEAALDVARAAERVERVNARRSESKRRQLSRKNTTDEEGVDGLMESFHSDMSRNTSSTSNNEDYRRMALSTGDLLEGRGRSMRRIGTVTPGELDDQATPLASAQAQHHGEDVRTTSRRDTSRSLSLARNTSGRGGRRVAGVAFMSVGLLFRGYYGTEPISTGLSRGGHVLSAGEVTGSTYRHPPIHSTLPVQPAFDYTYVTFDKHPPIPDEPASYVRLIGRISAWCCTTLYLTSRLPQIWKNYNRKSVEGLSILLFLFAFCGNFAYVLSILLNPIGTGDPSEAGHYLLEALPYLLGSGGTLMFDLTIMIQSWMYGSAPPLQFAPHRKLRLPGRKRWRHVEDARGPGASTERAPLLAGHPQPARSRSFSPDVTIRFTPASVPNDDR